MLPISVCIIAKNEELHIGECLKRLSAFDWEIVVADTGSTDRTPQIAANYTPHVYPFKWTDDFSAARNFAVSKASYDWILTVDCDEYLENADYEAFCNWFSQNCGDNGATLLGRYLIQNVNSSLDGRESTCEYVTRLFHRLHYRYDGRVHEQLLPLFPGERQTADIPLFFLHMGYAGQEIRLQKAERNQNLLLAQLETCGPDCYLYYQLGQCYFSVQNYEQASFYYAKALEMTDFPFPYYVQTLIESYGYCLLEQKQYQAALNLITEDLYAYFCRNADYVFLSGLILMNNGFFEQAAAEFLKAASIPAHRAEGVNSYKAYYNAGIIYECTGNPELACKYYKKCGPYKPALDRLNSLN